MNHGNSTCISKKKLICNLQTLETFTKPKLTLEQYSTGVQIAGDILYDIQSCYGDIENKIIGDLGCGPGMLSIGCALLGCNVCIGFEIDSDALVTCQDNLEEFDDELPVDLINCDVTSGFFSNRWQRLFDTVIMNPPFGTKSNEGIDMQFLKTGLDISNSVVYSLHKTATREYIKKKAKEWNISMDVKAELKFDLPRIYRHQKLLSKDIAVDFIRFEHIH